MKSKVFSRTACTYGSPGVLAVISIGARASSQNSNPTAFKRGNQCLFAPNHFNQPLSRGCEAPGL